MKVCWGFFLRGVGGAAGGGGSVMRGAGTHLCVIYIVNTSVGN